MGENISNSVTGGSHGTVVQMGSVYGTVTINNGQSAPGAELPSGAWEVPAGAPLLVDRAQERAGLGAWFRGAAPGVARTAVVSGLHGVGKRELVRHIAHSLTDRHPEWQLYVDYAAAAEVGPAPGEGASSVVGLGDPDRALARCLSSLGLAEEHQPASPKERLAEFRRRCAGKQVLIVVENAATAAQIRMLTPGVPGSAVLATSRRYLGELKLDGARLLRLGPLDPEAGAELLTALMDDPVQAAEHQAAIVEVVALCGGLPLAIQVMAARLALHPGMTPARLAEELRDESVRLDAFTLADPDSDDLRGSGSADDPLQEGERSVRRPLDLAYRDLTPEQAAVYRVVGLLPVASFDAAVVAAALAVDAASIRRVLDHLVRTCLLEAVGDGRFQVHPLVRLHARECAQREPQASPRPTGQAAEVLARVTEHYLVLAAQADRAVRLDRLRVSDLDGLIEGRANPFAVQGDNAGQVALAWLGRERDALLAVLREASGERVLADLVWPLAEALTVLFLHDRRLQEWQESLRIGVDAAVAASSDAGEARLRSMRSRPLLDLGRDDEAIRELDLAAEHAARSGHALLAASVHEMLGRYWLEHDPARAVAVFTRTVELNLAVPDDRGTALARLFLGVALNAAGEPAQALAALDRARAELEQLPTPDGRMAARARAAAGESYRLLGDLPRSREELRRAARGLHEHEATAYEADTRCLLAEVLLMLDPTDTSTARTELEQARQIYELGGNPKAVAVTARLGGLNGA
ncbi:hypothetical protein [Streptacidiphilus fuscans]|uniref:NB-ARC domain-containing protein n=1 Tax=Streptacidiphilus fuscans TaxID=2789292 RepID=A0A931B8A5_9ACTN|nr:hypothetical protein [Streptacidiphilus fuscans]MBF9073060.1 hypothetical protein [Streptacidiphilus fuscans]